MRYASASDNIAIGRFAAGGSSSTANTGSANVAIGYEAGKFATGAANVSIGYESLKGNTSGSAAEHNTAIGAYTLNVATTAESNTVVGHSAGGSVTTGDNNLLLGHDAGKSGSPGGAVSTGSNEIALGDENITECNIQVDWTVASDERDKTDFTALDVGLSFVNSLKPYTYKWDKRIKYVDKTKEDWDKDLDLNTITHDGTHKEDWLDIGFKAQEVEALEKDAGYKISDKTNLTTSLSGDGKQYGIKYSNFVPILVKALQELSAKNDALEARIKTLEG